MNDRVESFQVFRGKIANIFAHCGRLPATGYQRALAKVAGIKAGNFVAGAQQVRRHDRADVTIVSGDQNFPRFAHNQFLSDSISLVTATSRDFFSEIKTKGQPAASAAWPSRSSSPRHGVRLR